jgi:hypothetical protein
MIHLLLNYRLTKAVVLYNRKIMPNQNFRSWLLEKWFEHKDEVLMFGGEPFPDSGAYFKKYKWWLKSIYRRENR